MLFIDTMHAWPGKHTEEHTDTRVSGLIPQIYENAEIKVSTTKGQPQRGVFITSPSATNRYTSNGIYLSADKHHPEELDVLIDALVALRQAIRREATDEAAARLEHERRQEDIAGQMDLLDAAIDAHEGDWAWEEGR